MVKTSNLRPAVTANAKGKEFIVPEFVLAGFP
jgi:hypothetical protein